MLTLSERARLEIEKFADEVIKEIQNAIATKPVYKGKPAYTTGKTSNSLQKEWVGDTMVISGAGHIFVLEFGRKPTTGGGGGGLTLRAILRQWIEDKPGLAAGKSESEKNSMAYLMARSVHRKGTLLYQANKPTGTLSEAIDEKKIVELSKKVLDIFAVEVVSHIKAEVRT